MNKSNEAHATKICVKTSGKDVKGFVYSPLLIKASSSHWQKGGGNFLDGLKRQFIDSINQLLTYECI